MTSLIFLDSNVIIYAVTTGEFREAAQRVLQVARSLPGRFFVSTDILQEVLHHLRRRGHGEVAVGVIDDLLEAFAGSIEAVEPPRYTPRGRDWGSASDLHPRPGPPRRDGAEGVHDDRLGRQ